MSKAIEIRQTGNGFILSHTEGTATKIDEPMVFQSFIELTKYLEGHFDFRSLELLSDKPSFDPIAGGALIGQRKPKMTFEDWKNAIR